MSLCGHGHSIWIEACCLACQWVSTAAGAISKEENGSETEAYVDDTAGAAVEVEADSHYKGLLCTYNSLGPRKMPTPNCAVTWV